MPVDRKLMASLQEKYGKEKGRSVYYAMENKCRKRDKKGKKKPSYCDPIERAIKGGE